MVFFLNQDKKISPTFNNFGYLFSVSGADDLVIDDGESVSPPSTPLSSGVRLIMPELGWDHLFTRVCPRFFDQVGHETMYASSGNRHFFTKSCHCQTYQNYEQPPRTSKNSYFQSHFSVLKIGRIFLKKSHL